MPIQLSIILFNYFFPFSQHVERNVKILSEGCEQASGYDRIHEWCLNKQENCEKIPTGATKGHFLNMMLDQD